MKNFAGTGGESYPKEPGKFYLRALDPADRRTQVGISDDRSRRYRGPAQSRPRAAWSSSATTTVNWWPSMPSHGKHVWHFNLGQNITASPVTFLADGKQYVVIAGATDVFAFALF